jgi:hypothetical protein
MDENEARSCLGKFCYRSYNAARRAVRVRRFKKRNRKRQDWGELEPYRCRFCHRWHLGAAREEMPRRVAERMMKKYLERENAGRDSPARG